MKTSPVPSSSPTVILEGKPVPVMDATKPGTATVLVEGRPIVLDGISTILSGDHLSSDRFSKQKSEA